MAPGLVFTPSLRVIHDKLSSLIRRDLLLLQGFNKKCLEIISRDLSSIIRFVAEKCLEERLPEKLGDWVIMGINDDIYAAENLLDEIEIETLQWEYQLKQVSVSLSSQLISFEDKIKELTKMMKNIKDRLPSLIRKGNNLQLSINEIETRETPAEAVIYGRERETESMIQLLLLNSNNHLSISPILGEIAGVGKTTLAHLVYADQRIVANFDTRFWVSLAEDFSIQKIAQVMLTGENEICDVDLLDRLNFLLNGKKFLVVLDDVWNDDMEKWNRIIHLLACGGKGSSIIVTTRLQTVVHNITNLSASCVINPTCELRPLGENDALSLFKHYAIGEKNEVNEGIIEIGKGIVAKCERVPLLIKIIGNHMYHMNEQEWRQVLSNNFWVQVELEKSKVRSSLKSRYIALPPMYRQCFAYCFIFPKGYEIEVEELIRLWIANGLVQTDETMEMEDVVNEIVKELVSKSFFQNPEKNWLGIKTFKLQDSMYDLAWFVARFECVSIAEGDQLATIPERVRHLLVSDGAQPGSAVNTFLKTFSRTPLSTSISKPFRPSQLYTCIFPPMSNPPLPIFFKKLTCLRALHLKGSTIRNLPSSIENLKHLRYLNLSSSVDLQFLPESICSLICLQMLELSQCWELQILPESIGKLIDLRYLYLSDCRSLVQLPVGIEGLNNLRHLDLSECDSLIQIPDAIGRLRNLRHLDLHDCKTFSQLPDVIGQLTNLIYLDISSCPNLNALPHGIANLVNLRRLNLSKLLEVTHLPLLEFILGSDSGLSIGDLHRLNNLEGELLIGGLEHVKDGAEAKEANLVAKVKLSSLSLVWEDSHVDDNNNSNEVIECLRPPRNLNKLVIEAYRGLAFPTWTKLLTNVVEIQLSGCSECEDLPPLGHLPFLKKLCIFGMHSLKRVNKEFYGVVSIGSEAGETSQGKGFFPFLEELEFRELRNWEEWQVLDDAKVFLRLQKLRLDECPNLALLPSAIYHSVQKFEITRCEKLMAISPPI